MVRLWIRFAVALMAVAWGLKLASPAAAQDADNADALNAEVSRLYKSGKYAEAISLAERSLELAREQKGPDHLDTANRMQWLGSLYQVLGRYADAERLYKSALLLTEKAVGPDHPDVGDSLQSLASVYRVFGRYPEAEAFYKRALAVKEKALGPDHLDVSVRGSETIRDP